MKARFNNHDDPASSNGHDDRYSIQVLQRALGILDTLLEARGPLSLEAISRRSGTPRSTTFRILTNLRQRDYITETGDGYWLGLKLLSLGAAVESQLDFRAAALAEMRALREACGETVYLAVLTGDMQVIYVEKLASDQPVGVMMANVGMTAPMHSTALGKILAAHLPVEQVRAWLETRGPLPARTAQTLTEPEALLRALAEARGRGYAVDERENYDGIRCIAAPVFDNRGAAVAAISAAGPDHRMPTPLHDSPLAFAVCEAAARTSAALGAAALIPHP